MINDYKRMAIIGFGSIAGKHIQTVGKLIPNIKFEILTSQNIDSFDANQDLGIHSSINTLLDSKPDVIAVTSPSSQRHTHIHRLANLKAPILLEKPISSTFEQAVNIENFFDKHSIKPVVAYNLRFTRAIYFLKDFIASGNLGKIYNVQCVVGQNLNQWRPGRNVDSTVSARRNLGGGVLRELSHELDYLAYLFGPPSFVSGVLGKQKFGNFDVEDTAMLVLEFQLNCDRILCSLNMDFIREDATRFCHIIGEKSTLKWDLMRGTIHGNSFQSGEVELFNFDKDLEYSRYEMWKAFLSGKHDKFCSISEGARYLKIIEQIECKFGAFQ